MTDRLREQIYTASLFLMGFIVYDKDEFTKEQYNKLTKAYDSLTEIYNEEISVKKQQKES